MTDMEMIDEILAEEVDSGEIQEPTENEAIEAETEQVEEQPVEVIQEPVVEPEPTPEPEIQQEQPQPRDALLEQLIANQNALQEQNQLMQQQLAQPQAQPEPELTEEEQAMKELEERMGVSALKQENEQLKQQIQEIAQFKEQQQAMMEQQRQQAELQSRIASEIDAFTRERPDANQDAIVDYIEKAPEALRSALDNPDGWRWIDDQLKAQAQPVAQPDKIVSTQSSQPTVKKVDTSRMTQQEQEVMQVDDLLRSIGQL